MRKDKRTGTAGHSGAYGKQVILLALLAVLFLSACTVEDMTKSGETSQTEAAEEDSGAEAADIKADQAENGGIDAEADSKAQQDEQAEEKEEAADSVVDMLARRAGALFKRDADGRVSKAYVDEEEVSRSQEDKAGKDNEGSKNNEDSATSGVSSNNAEPSGVIYSNGIGPVSVSGNSIAAAGVSGNSNSSAGVSGNSSSSAGVSANESAASGKNSENAKDSKKDAAQDEEAPYIEPTGERKRRTLPQAEPGKAAASAKADYPARTKPEFYEGPSVMFIEKKRVGEKKITAQDSSFPTSEQDVQLILGNLASFWASYNIEAVDYLIRMDKYRYLSQLLEGTNEYFYFGDTNSAGEPHGTGLACYANNQYYYGSFENGVRSGDGYWYQIFVRGGAYCRENNGIYSHTYHGEWADDYPCGNGQEHLDIDTQYLKERIATNVIGSFKDGYYHGDEIVTTLTPGDTHLLNWRGTAIDGEWIAAGGNYGMLPDGTILNIAALETAEDVNEVPDRYFWMLAKENIGQGITGLIKADQAK